MRILLAVSVLVTLFSCEPKSEFFTSGGVRVTYHTHGDGELPKYDSILMLQMDQTADGSKVLFKSTADFPLTLPYRKDMRGPLMEVIGQLVEGDSVSFEITAEELFDKTYGGKIPQILSPESTVFIALKFVRQYTENDFQVVMEEMRRKQSAFMQEKEILSIDRMLTEHADSISRYLKKKDQPFQRTVSGLHYQILKDGKGTPAASGDQLTIRFTCKLLDGTTLAQMEDTMTIGVGEIIPGLEEAFGFLTPGSQAILYIPGPLAYGKNPPTPSTPVNAILIYEIEVLK